MNVCPTRALLGPTAQSWCEQVPHALPYDHKVPQWELTPLSGRNCVRSPVFLYMVSASFPAGQLSCVRKSVTGTQSPAWQRRNMEQPRGYRVLGCEGGTSVSNGFTAPHCSYFVEDGVNLTATPSDTFVITGNVGPAPSSYIDIVLRVPSGTGSAIKAPTCHHGHVEVDNCRVM